MIFFLTRVAQRFSPLCFHKEKKIKNKQKRPLGLIQNVDSIFVEFMPYVFLPYNTLAPEAATSDGCPGSSGLTILEYVIDLQASVLFASNQNQTLMVNTIPVTNALSLVNSLPSKIRGLASQAFLPLQEQGVRI